MCPVDRLLVQLQALAGRDYAAYQSLRGDHAHDRFRLRIDRTPKDLYAPPGTGAFRVSVSRGDAGFPDDYCASRVSYVAFRVARVVADIEENGLDILQPERTGDLAGVRGLDIAAALNRVRGLVFHQVC